MRGDFIKDPEKRLMVQIEKTRRKLYRAYENDAAFDRLITISEELDQLLNQLATINRENKKEKKVDI